MCNLLEYVIYCIYSNYMENYKEIIKKYFERFNLKNKSTIIPLIFTVSFGIVLFIVPDILGKYLLSIGIGANLVLWTILMLLILAVVGIAVMKALVYISAGLSLIIFLSQSYCDVLPHTSSGNESLRFLIMTSLTFLVFEFFKIFYEGMAKYFEKFKNMKKEYFLKTILVIFFIIIAFTFLSSIYQVTRPIILDLCVYK